MKHWVHLVIKCFKKRTELCLVVTALAVFKHQLTLYCILQGQVKCENMCNLTENNQTIFVVKTTFLSTPLTNSASTTVTPSF